MPITKSMSSCEEINQSFKEALRRLKKMKNYLKSDSLITCNNVFSEF